MKTGYIYILKERFRYNYGYNNYEHPFIFWKDTMDSYIGIMLTTKNRNNYNNIMLEKSHIENGHRFTYGKSMPGEKSYIVPAALIKDIELGHFELIGSLTLEGIEFIRERISKLPNIDWNSYKELDNNNEDE